MCTMLILVDEAIPCGARLFGEFGEVRTFDGRQVAPIDLRDADALVVRSVTRVDGALLEGSRIRFVGSATSGSDHVDIAWLAAQGIHYVAAEGCNSRAVAEYVLAAILHLCELQQIEPRERTLGVIGVGRIGAMVRDMAGRLGLRVLGCDPPRRAAGAAELVELEQLLAESDLVTLHVPLTDDGPYATRGMVNAAWLSSLRPGTAIINTSRGHVVCEADLLAAIDSGRVSHAVIDVWQNEPLINTALADRATIATPHIAGYTHESRQRAAAMIRDALGAWIRPDLSSDARKTTLSEIEPMIEEFPLPVMICGPESLADGLLAATDLLGIDAELRDGLASNDPAEVFDSLRARCATRREFSTIQIDGQGLDDSLRRQFVELGFKVIDRYRMNP